MSLAASALDTRGLAVVVALTTALAMVAREPASTPEPTQKRVTEPAPDTSDRESSSPRYALPGGGGREITDYRPSLVLQVRIDGAVRVKGKPFSDPELDNLFRAVFVHDLHTQIVIKAHRGVAHARVVDVLERAKQSGLTRFAIGTSDEP